MRYTYRYRSFFWPALLILAGIVALLVNVGQIPVERVFQAVNLWPLILVVIGLELIIRRLLHGVTGDVAAALVVLIAIVGAATYVAVAPNPPANETLDVSGPLGDVQSASLEIDAGAATVKISSDAAAVGDLYKAHIAYSGTKPDVTFDASSRKLTINQRGNNFMTFQSRRFELDLQINPKVTWAVELNTGATSSTLDLSQVQLKSLSINSGAAKDEITLGPASGAVAVEIDGGALTVKIHRPQGTEASVDVSGGALTLDADGRGLHGIGHQSYESPGFSNAANAYRIEINGGACTVTLDTATG
jgi:cell wall-active antibiotic response 4TMS protein YvqF